MSENKWEQIYAGCHAKLTAREENCLIYRLKDEEGEAVITRYEVYPGISLVYNDVHKQHIAFEKQVSNHHLLEINHCREGRIEFETNEGDYVYLKKGDMAINTKSSLKNYANFPQCHYHGVTIEMDLDILKAHPISLLEEIHVTPSQMKDQFCKENRCFILHEKEEFEHLFAELYCVPEKIKIRYYKLKVVEIMLFLSAIDPKRECALKRYFNKDLVALVKEAHGYMIKHLEEKITIDFLAEKYHLSPTNLKNGFRAVYGNSLYAYLKEYRIHKATEFLRNSEFEIGYIAGLVGYDNASKFAKSFKAVMGINPSEYRKRV